MLFWQFLWWNFWDFWHKWLLGVQKGPKKFEELLRKIDICFTKNGEIIVYHIFAVAATG